MLLQYDTKRRLRICSFGVQARPLRPILDAHYCHLRPVCLLIFSFIHNFLSLIYGVTHPHIFHVTSGTE